MKRNRRTAFTLVELLVTLSIIAFMSIMASYLIINSMRSYGRTNVSFEADRRAAVGLQILNRDLEEAKDVTVLTPYHIRVFYPKKLANGSYDRTRLDTVNYVEFYRGTTTGPNSAKSTLIRKPVSGHSKVICKNVDQLTYEKVGPTSLQITLVTKEQQGQDYARCLMVHRAVYFRNY